MKDEKFLILKILILSIALSACQKIMTENERIESQPLPSVSPTLNLSPTPIADPNLPPIRKIDFSNFTYPEIEDFPETFTLKNGEKPFKHGEEIGIDLGRTEYSDVTGDGEEEAILTMSIQTGGSSIPNLIYIYTLENGKPKLLWGFMTGDRAGGGLKKVYTENDELIVELFGKDRFIESKNVFDFPNEIGLKNGLCCPTDFTKFRFEWNGKKFVIKVKPELFDYERKNQTDSQ